MHRVEIAIAAVIEGERVVSVGPDGGHGGVAALRDDAAERPRVDQIPSEDYVLDENVGGFPILFSGAGAGVGRRRRWISVRCCGVFGAGVAACATAHDVFEEMPM